VTEPDGEVKSQTVTAAAEIDLTEEGTYSYTWSLYDQQSV
jgi:hypothetical protein